VAVVNRKTLFDRSKAATGILISGDEPTAPGDAAPASAASRDGV
jgi:hypothetical protein